MIKTIVLSFSLLLMISISFGQTQLEMNQKAEKDQKKADLIMTKVYKEAMAKCDENGKKLLLEAQKAWIKYKEAHCRSEASAYEGGSMQPMIWSMCITEMTEQRTKLLKTYLEEN